MLIAALGGITVGIGLAALLGTKRAKHLLRSLGNTLVNASGKFVERSRWLYAIGSSLVFKKRGTRIINNENKLVERGQGWLVKRSLAG